MLFVFIMNNAEPAVDFTTGISHQPSVAITAQTYENAVGVLAAHCAAQNGGSDDPEDYQSDIEEGNITVLIPAVFA